ncbi:hypothetical protein [Microlunatus soli]|uniref:Glycosyl hydrolase family 20, domain 2 n=1 Tax=Microlunatus soli TaxID=630515 RepID=A0A1H1ZKF4_9ACTN|nr:hypothetical protein [Microlunatus soli]SDT34275.1 hypothetical protein SAMN04489812_5286 [Microlunatus soli]
MPHPERSSVIAWASDQLKVALPTDAQHPSIAIDPTLAREAFRFSRSGDGTLLVSGGDDVGVAYGLAEVADRARFATDPSAALASIGAEEFAPRTPVRGMLRTFSSDALDLPWFRSEDFWSQYLDELATHRINRFQLALGMQYNFSHDLNVVDNYFCLAYPFLIDVPGYDVRVAGVDENERAANLAALRSIGDQCRRRGIDFQLGLWNHALHSELGEAKGLRYRIRGLREDQVAGYTSKALPTLLRAVPTIKGITLRVHYEGGVPEGERSNFWREALSGMADLDRQVSIDVHSKGVDAALLDIAGASSRGKVEVSAKYWAEHMGLPYHQTAVRDLEKARPSNDDDLRGITQNARRFTRYGIGDFLSADRPYDFLFRVWPGSQRFLLSASPELLSGYARESVIGGAVGVEWCEPLTFRGRKNSGFGNRDLYRDDELSNGLQDWKKYRYFYRLAGRLMYDPDADPTQWRRYLSGVFGEAAGPIEDALSVGSRVLPLVTTVLGMSASNNFFWPEVPTNFPLAHTGGAGVYDFDTAEPKLWGGISPFDPAIFDTTYQYVASEVDGEPTGRYTPVEVARWLDGLARSAVAALDAAASSVVDPTDPEFVRVDVDVRIQAALARFYAARIRAGIRYARYEQAKNGAELLAAVEEYAVGREAFAEVITLADGVYADEICFGDRVTERGHWTDRLDQLDRDLAALRKEAVELPGDPSGAVALPLAMPERVPDPLTHQPPANFEPGNPLPLRVEADAASVEVRFRHLHQGESYRRLQLRHEGGVFIGELPDDVADGSFPVQYYFVVETDTHRRQVSPGIGESLCQRPYHVVPSSTTA